MSLHPLAGKPAPPELLIDVAKLERYYHAQARPARPAATRQLRHQRPSRHVRSTAPSPKRTSWPSPRPSANIAASRRSTARSSSARTRTPCPARPSAPPWKCWPPTASRPSSSKTTASRRRRSSRTPSSPTTAAARTSLADGIVITPSHNPPSDGGFKYNPPNGGPADTDVTGWIQDRANALLASRQPRASSASPSQTAHQGGDHARSTISSLPYVNDLDNVDRHGRDPRAPG